ncbi:hypothetical protein ANN_19962 [Periplaneta americana]|uniref:Reverse transcriptase domain-containing protein n=1 Tax=Periplaneta americana TaxID=6978 RepID=A0ABQ8SBJ0_PERAM|nr:hypothetical protein ANN_19962 [Periplaneta americana]
MSPGSSTESYPAFARVRLRENPGKTSTRTRTALEDAFNSLLDAAKRMGLQVNEKKTKYMISNPSRAYGADDFLEIGNYNFDQ